MRASTICWSALNLEFGLTANPAGRAGMGGAAAGAGPALGPGAAGVPGPAGAGDAGRCAGLAGDGLFEVGRSRGNGTFTPVMPTGGERAAGALEASAGGAVAKLPTASVSARAFPNLPACRCTGDITPVAAAGAIPARSVASIWPFRAAVANGVEVARPGGRPRQYPLIHVLAILDQDLALAGVVGGADNSFPLHALND